MPGLEISGFFFLIKEVGVPPAQAEAEASALSEVLDINLKELPTKDDFHHEIKVLESRMDTRFEKQSGELGIIKWMQGLLLAGVASIVIKTFF